MIERVFTSTQDRPAAVSFVDRMVQSDAFKTLFRDGMTLVEATASYLDGDGRAESRALTRGAALAYATESMRLTTRLMQITSWLLLQRAVNEGELTRDEAEAEHRKVKMSPQETTSSSDLTAQLPAQLKDLIAQSLRLQQRIMMIDSVLQQNETPVTVNPVAVQLNALKLALRGG
jgi:regulator of CtrA degradation